jgi:hypothetical protein
MFLGPGTRLGPYEIVAPIGAGGMGEVYQATDTNLGRDVAIKVLPEGFAQDPDRIARFEREAKTLASLNHSNIAIIHGLEKSQGTYALVMELVDGETLADRIARGPIPVDEALPIAKQLAEALEAAHEQGIIHRDLKPANIKVRSDGTVKVLDFGLAKLAEASAGPRASDFSLSPTITSPAMTGVGVLLGTAAYMAPEQARGKSVDKRSDVWAFGCVLYEMLTGRRAFEGDEVSDVLASILAREPDWTLLPRELSSVLGTFVKRCLNKDRKQRIGDAQTVRLALDGAFEAGAETADFLTRHHATPWRRVMTVSTAAAVCAAALTGSAVWLEMRPDPPLLIRTEISTAGATALRINGLDRDLAITPDGSRVAYRGENQLFVRALDQLTPTSLSGSGLIDPRGLFMSPDGQWVGFFDATTLLKKIAITGGPPVDITKIDSGGVAPRGATWAEDGTIIYGMLTPGTGLQRVSAMGGPSKALTTPDRARGERNHWWPEVIPGTQAVLFTSMPVTGGLENAQIAVLDLRTNTQTVLVRGGYHGHYVSSGHLVYGAEGTLRAIAFDKTRLAVTGAAVPVADKILTTANGAIDAVVALNGTLVYVSGGLAALQARTLVWVDRQGREESINVPPRAYVYAQLSPDGTKIAVDIRDQEQDVWIWDLARTTLQRLTFDPFVNRVPVWSHDGHRLAFSRTLDNAEEVYWQSADGSGVPEPLTKESKASMNPSDFSPDGTMLLYTPANPPWDIWMVPVKGPPTTGAALLNGRANERNPVVSPDGRWLAYESDESGRFEIYVRPFPEVSTGRWQISTNGGTRPRWSRNGRELFYYIGGPQGGMLMAVAVELTPPFRASTPKMLFQGNYPAPNAGGALYDVSRDGQRFLMIKNLGGEEVGGALRQIVVVQHFDEELKRLVPTK